MRLSTPALVGLRPATAARTLNGHTGIVASSDARGNVLVAIGHSAAIIARSDTATGDWLSIHATLDADADSGDVARFNRLLSGWCMPDSPAERDWRAPKPLMIRIGGGRAPVKAPLSMTADLAGVWSVTPLSAPLGVSAVVGAGGALGSTPLPIATSVTPTGATIATPVAGGILPHTAPPVTPITPVAPVVTPPTGGVTGSLPANHPGIFREGVGSAHTMHLDPLNAQRIESALRGFSEGDGGLILMRGPAGSGKTQTLYSVAHDHGLPVAVFHVQGMRDFSDWAGRVELTEVGGATVTTYLPSQFVEAITPDGPYGGRRRVIVLDEISRAETSSALNALLSLTDGQRSLYIPDARRTIYVDPTVMFAMTANIGRDYTGTIELDTALADRVTCWVRCDYADAATEALILTEQARVTNEDALRLVRVAQSTRAMAERLEIKRGASTRALIEAGNHLRRGILPPVEAIMAGFGDYYSDEGGTASEVAKVRSAASAVFGGAA